jgi:hypothetical protein
VLSVEGLCRVHRANIQPSRVVEPKPHWYKSGSFRVSDRLVVDELEIERQQDVDDHCKFTRGDNCNDLAVGKVSSMVESVFAMASLILVSLPCMSHVRV